MRFYNNNIKSSDKNEEVTMCTADSNSLSKTAPENKEMKKKVIRRLINVSLPTSDSKKKCFEKVNNDEETCVIILFASDNSNFVEDTKHMILNFYD